MQVSAYLNFNGDCEAALSFYERALGGKIYNCPKEVENPNQKEEHAYAGAR